MAWLVTEWTEGTIDETRRPVRDQGRRSWRYVRRTAPYRSHSARSSDEAPSWAWSEGAQEDGFGKEIPREETVSPVIMNPLSRQGGEVRTRWVWTEPSVWTARRLTALKTGVKRVVWFNRIDKVYSRGNVETAFGKVKANKESSGVNHMRIKRFEQGLEMELERLETQP